MATTIRSAVIAAINCEYDHTGDFWHMELIDNLKLWEAANMNYLSERNTMNQVKDYLRMKMCEKYGRSWQVEY